MDLGKEIERILLKKEVKVDFIKTRLKELFETPILLETDERIGELIVESKVLDIDVVELILDILEDRECWERFNKEREAIGGILFDIPIWGLVRAMCNFIAPSHTERLVKLLLVDLPWAKFRLNRAEIMYTLGEKGNLSIVPLLEEYAKIVQKRIQEDVVLLPLYYADSAITANLQFDHDPYDFQDEMEVGEAIKKIKNRN